MNLSLKIEHQFPSHILRLGQELAELSEQSNLGVVVVGGGVRDLLLGWSFEEADFMIEHPAQAVVEALAKKHGAKLVVHDRFKTFSLYFSEGTKLDVATARRERYSNPAQLPDVETSSHVKIGDDLIRRDFSVNSMAVWMNPSRYGELLDPFGGLKDLNNKTIRALHSQSFIDDPTRIFRAARFAGRYGFSIDRETESWILRCIHEGIPSRLSAVRRRHEFDLILKERDPMPILKILSKWNALVCIHSGWSLSNETVDQYHFAEPTFETRLAQWFMYFGKQRAEIMMTELAYEKKVKIAVLNSFV